MQLVNGIFTNIDTLYNTINGYVIPSKIADYVYENKH